MSKGMTKGELVGNIAEKAGVSKKDAEKVLNAVLSSITEALASGRKVQLVGFGTFEVRHREARTGRNPRDPGKTIHIPSRDVPAFKPGKALKEAVKYVE